MPSLCGSGRFDMHYHRSMATPVNDDSELKPGDFFEDCSYHPCLCVRSQDGQVDGISLVDGSFPRNCGIPACGIRKLTAEEAITWRLHGPQQRPPEYDATMLPPTTNAPDWWRKDVEFANMLWPLSGT
jgi:hypothetical protein